MSTEEDRSGSGGSPGIDNEDLDLDLDLDVGDDSTDNSGSRGNETKGSSQSTEKPKKIQRSSFACKLCKQRKKRCSGSIPCVSCVAKGVKCEFPVPQCRRGPKSSKDATQRGMMNGNGRGIPGMGADDVVDAEYHTRQGFVEDGALLSGVMHEAGLLPAVVRKQFLNLFFEFSNPLFCFFPGIYTADEFLDQKGANLQVAPVEAAQFNCIIGSIARVCGHQLLANALMERVRGLARSLYDESNIETATLFYFMSMYYEPEDAQKSGLYRQLGLTHGKMWLDRKRKTQPGSHQFKAIHSILEVTVDLYAKLDSQPLHVVPDMLRKERDIAIEQVALLPTPTLQALGSIPVYVLLQALGCWRLMQAGVPIQLDAETTTQDRREETRGEADVVDLSEELFLDALADHQVATAFYARFTSSVPVFEGSSIVHSAIMFILCVRRGETVYAREFFNHVMSMKEIRFLRFFHFTVPMILVEFTKHAFQLNDSVMAMDAVDLVRRFYDWYPIVAKVAAPLENALKLLTVSPPDPVQQVGGVTDHTLGQQPAYVQEGMHTNSVAVNSGMPEGHGHGHGHGHMLTHPHDMHTQMHANLEQKLVGEINDSAYRPGQFSS
eukprot:GFYU01001294.1.p1 GENE.GFYU01001294.1~~GFYU01001294.1.p1  ORF type:complete len:657 (-),score=86.16 GFYU01001294.1:30-1853(-)